MIAANSLKRKKFAQQKSPKRQRPDLESADGRREELPVL
jgi:hypothetical protein